MDNQMLAYYLMQNGGGMGGNAASAFKPAASPLAGLANGFSYGMNMGRDPFGQSQQQGGGVWQALADIFNGVARKGKSDKMDPGAVKSWMDDPAANAATSAADSAGWGNYF